MLLRHLAGSGHQERMRDADGPIEGEPAAHVAVLRVPGRLQQSVRLRRELIDDLRRPLDREGERRAGGRRPGQEDHQLVLAVGVRKRLAGCVAHRFDSHRVEGVVLPVGRIVRVVDQVKGECVHPGDQRLHQQQRPPAHQPSIRQVHFHLVVLDPQQPGAVPLGVAQIEPVRPIVAQGVPFRSRDQVAAGVHPERSEAVEPVLVDRHRVVAVGQPTEN